jgi:transposase InsO family protein
VPAPNSVCANADELASHLVRHFQSYPRYRAQRPRSALGAAITYVHLSEEFVYLAVVLDAFSGKVVGWALDTHLQAQLAISALIMAITVIET